MTAPADMVAAVTPAKEGPPAELKFELRQLPQAGQMLDVDIAVVPDAPQIERIYAKFQGSPGLDLVEGAELASVAKPVAGALEDGSSVTWVWVFLFLASTFAAVSAEEPQPARPKNSTTATAQLAREIGVDVIMTLFSDNTASRAPKARPMCVFRERGLNRAAAGGRPRPRPAPSDP